MTRPSSPTQCCQNGRAAARCRFPARADRAEVARRQARGSITAARSLVRGNKESLRLYRGRARKAERPVSRKRNAFAGILNVSDPLSLGVSSTVRRRPAASGEPQPGAVLSGATVPNTRRHGRATATGRHSRQTGNLTFSLTVAPPIEGASSILGVASPRARPLPSDRIGAPEFSLAWARICRVAQPDPPTGMNGQAFDRCSIVLRLFVVERSHPGNRGLLGGKRVSRDRRRKTKAAVR